MQPTRSAAYGAEHAALSPGKCSSEGGEGGAARGVAPAACATAEDGSSAAPDSRTQAPRAMKRQIAARTISSA